MTREEAKLKIEWIRDGNDFMPTDAQVIALDMAIEALKQPIVAKCYEIENDHIYCSPETAEEVCKALHLYHSTNVQNLHNGDLISREDAIKVLAQVVFDEPPYLDSESLCREYAEDKINALPSAKAEWIPCSERLPNESGQYICTLPFGDNDDNEVYVWALSFHNGRFYDDDDEWGMTFYDDVIAWQPLPKPYKGGDDE